MNIIHIMKDYKPNIGGSVVRNSNMIESYCSLFNDKVIVLNIEGDKYGPHSIEHGVEVYRCRSLIPFIIKIIELVKTESIDIIHAHNFRFLFAGYIAHLLVGRRTKVAVELHAIYSVNTIKERLTYWMLSKVDLISVLSESAKEYLVQQRGINPSRIIILRNGRTEESLAPTESELSSLLVEVHSRYFIVAYTGSFIKWQGVCFIADNFDMILSKNPNAFLLFVGDGEEFDYIYNKASKCLYNDRILVSHTISKAEMESIIDMIDVVIIPREKNLCTNTAIPLKAVEAMQKGKCILASNDDGLTELLNDSNARIFPAFDAVSFTSQLSILINDTELRLNLGEKAKCDANNFLKSWVENAKYLRESYCKMMK